jgi:hypothetical protein
MLKDAKVLSVTGDSYSVELTDSDLGTKQVCFHMPWFNQQAFDRAILHLHTLWTIKGNAAEPTPKPVINIARILASMNEPEPIKPDPEPIKPEAPAGPAGPAEPAGPERGQSPPEPIEPERGQSPPEPIEPERGQSPPEPASGSEPAGGPIEDQQPI